MKLSKCFSKSLGLSLLVTVSSLITSQSTLAAPGKPYSIGLFEKSVISQILEQNKNRDLAANRDALKAYFPKLRNKHSHLGGLSKYLRTLDDPRAKHLLAFTLMSDKQYQSAMKVLTELANDPKPDAWVTAELARVKQLIELQSTWNLTANGNTATALSNQEKKRVDEIVKLDANEARMSMNDFTQELLEKYGDLSILITYLQTGETTPDKQTLIAIAALENGDTRAAQTALSGLVTETTTDPWILSELARIREMLGNTESATALFLRALKSNKDPQTHFALSIRTAQLLYDAGKPKEAAVTLRSAKETKALSSVELTNYCARIAALYGDHQLVAEWYKPTGTGKALQMNLIFLGESLLKIGKFDQARQNFEAAFDLAKLSHDRRYILDRIVTSARTANVLPKVVDEWTKSNELSPEQLDILVNILGGELGRVDEVFAFTSRTDLPEKTLTFIKSPAFQERLAVLGAADGSWDAAEHYRKLMKQQPDEPTYRDGYVKLLLLDGDRSKALSVYTDAIAATAEPSKLMDIAAGARRTGLMDIANKAAAKAAEAGGKAPLQSGLFTAALYREEGKSDKALKVLRDLEANLEADDADGMMLLSGAFERLDDSVTTIRLCRQAYEITKSERVLKNLINLLEQQNLHDEAFDLWKQLWKTAQDPMTIIQANDRLLDLGARNGRLADLAIELEDSLAEKNLQERELTLLLDIYTSVGDPVSAADVLMIIAKRSGDELALQERLLKVYMKSELFGKCNKILQKLIEIDPENRDDHLQILAIIALERQNNGDAMVVLEQLARRTEDGVLRDSFSASVLSMLGKHLGAANAFRRGLASNPDDVESWLLWGNALAARDEIELERIRQEGKRPPAPESQAGNIQTRALFTSMLENAEADDLFVICVDGLLNARAPRQTMLNALRRLNARIAANPHNLLLHRLSADLNEDINRSDKVQEILEMALTVAGDSRPFIMRELITMAKSAKQPEVEIQYGRSLLNVTEHLPPAESLALGSMLINRGFTAEAEVAFQRVVGDANAVGSASDVATQYENLALFDKAAKVIRTLIIENPFDVQLHLRLALLEEKRGRFDKASEIYFKALEIMISQLPRHIASNDSNNNSKISINDIDQFYDLTVRGLIGSTRQPEKQLQLVQTVQKMMLDEIEALNADKVIASQLSNNPRLRTTAILLRRLGFLFHHAAIADNVDERLLKLYPNDTAVPKEAVASRKRWQTILSAGKFLQKQQASRNLKSMTAPFAKDKKAIAKLANDPSLTPAERSAVATLLAMFGHDELINNALSGVDLNRTSLEDSELLVTVGLATNRADLTRDVLLTNLNRLRRELEPLAGMDKGRAYLRPTKLYKQILAAWPALTPQDKSTATNLYGMMIDKSYGYSQMTSLHHFLLSISGRSSEIPVEALRHYVDRDFNFIHGHIATIINRWLGDHPAADRPAAIRKFLENKNGDARAYAIAKLPRYLSPETITPELLKEFPALANRPWNLTDLDETTVDMDKKRKEFASRIDSALSSMRGDVRRLFVLHDLTLRPAANLLSRPQLDLLNEKYLKSEDPFAKIVAFLLLKHAGRDIEAYALMQDIAAMSTEDDKAEAALAALPHFLKPYGWDLPALALMQRNSTSPIRNLKVDFMRHDPLAILADKQGDLLDISTRRIHATSLMGSAEQFKQAVQIYQADTRHPDIALTHRSAYKASKWPARLTPDSGGLGSLKDKQKNHTDSILYDIANLEDGQNQLNHLLRSLTPSSFSSEGAICDQIAAQAAKDGLSPQISNELITAAKRSALNTFDLKLIQSLAKIAPQTLPKELANQMEELALQNWRGSSRIPARSIVSRMNGGSFEDYPEQMSALAVASKLMGRDDLASSFGRWSIAQDILDNGCSRHLGSYINQLPAAERRQALEDLLPFLGFHDARAFTTEGLGELLQVLLNEGMADAAASQVDTYLRFRLPGRKTSRLSTLYLATIGGITSGTNAKDDAVAVALARLDRPDDYLSLLWRKHIDARYTRSPINLGMSISPMPMINSIGALPEPSQVKDIDKYLNLHLALNKRLRKQGIIDAQNQVAQLCLLGEWCVTHDLKQQANNFLTEAEKLSTDMLLGRLWVVDLQRLLEKDSIATEREAELLSRDLLPLPRIENTLEALAIKEGEARANFAAYRQSRFTNQADVLTRSLEHAQAEELKTEFLELAERLRQVNTLFLPENAPCPFEGYASIPEWSAAISAKAAKLPAKAKPKPLTSLADDAHPAIARAFTKGDQPQVIYVPIIHDDDYSHLAANGTADIRRVMENCMQISDRLYKRYGVRNIQLEGLSKQFVDKYNRIPVQRRNWNGKGQGMIVHQTWGELLAEKSWKLLPASNKPLVGPLTALGRTYEAKIVASLDKAKANGWFKNQEAYTKNKAQLDAELKTIADEYNGKLRDILKEDPLLKREYDITVTQRNREFLNYILAPKQPGVVFFGVAHWQDLKQQLDKKGTSYAVIVPTGVSWPPKHKDEQIIFTDMKALGAQLKDASLTLGDGTRTNINIPIE